MDSIRIDVGQAIASRMKPVCPRLESNRLAVSPAMLAMMPTAISSHGVRRRPASTVEPPTTRHSSNRSPIGYERLVTVSSDVPPVSEWMLWNAKAAHTAAAPVPATAPSSQLGLVSRRTSPRMNSTRPTYASGKKVSQQASARDGVAGSRPPIDSSVSTRSPIAHMSRESPSVRATARPLPRRFRCSPRTMQSAAPAISKPSIHQSLNIGHGWSGGWVISVVRYPIR